MQGKKETKKRRQNTSEDIKLVKKLDCYSWKFHGKRLDTPIKSKKPTASPFYSKFKNYWKNTN